MKRLALTTLLSILVAMQLPAAVAGPTDIGPGPRSEGDTLNASEAVTARTSTAGPRIGPAMYENSALADIGEELFAPPGGEAAKNSARSPAPRNLPPVPSAVFMALTGFLCISLVRDRSIWLAAAVSVLWAGQVGLFILPQAALRTVHRTARHKHKQPGKLTPQFSAEAAGRTRSDIEGTAYIALLRKLSAIPDFKTLRNSIFRETDTASGDDQPAAIFGAACDISTAYSRPASMAGRFIHFTAAFSFDLIPRVSMCGLKPASNVRVKPSQ